MTTLPTIDAADLASAIPATDPDQVLAWPVVLKASQVYEHVQGPLWTYVSDRPLRWGAWWAQLARSSASAMLNTLEAAGRLQGHWRSSLCIARGEAMETLGSLVLGPRPECDPVKGTAREVVRLLGDMILAAEAARPPEPRLRSWSGPQRP